MCSWCWGFRPVWQRVKHQLLDRLAIEYVLGGLATDSDRPMPEEMQQALIQTWKKIQQTIPGTIFNFDFWTHCQPRRSTYPSCRAMIAAMQQNPQCEENMLLAIQTAYYLQAKNPSDVEVLVDCAAQTGLDARQFLHDMQSGTTNDKLVEQIHFAEQLGAQGYPSLILQHNQHYHNVTIDYNDADYITSQIDQLIAGS